MFYLRKGRSIFLGAAGIVTTLASLPTMLSSVGGLHFSPGLTYFDQNPQVFPLIGHWGVMMVGIGVLLFLSVANKQIRKTATIFSTLEKSYMVSAALYCVLIDAPCARSYLAALIGDSSMVLAGIWYLSRSRQLNQD